MSHGVHVYHGVVTASESVGLDQLGVKGGEAGGEGGLGVEWRLRKILDKILNIGRKSML